MLSNTTDKQFSTEPLDNAMKELLDICQQYNDKFSNKQSQGGTKSLRTADSCNESLANSKYGTSPTMSKIINDKSYPTQSNAATKCDIKINKNRDDSSAFHRYGDQNMMQPSTLPSSSNDEFHKETSSLSKSQSGSIERLQQRQCELQIQLDEVMGFAKSLEAKHKKKKLNSILNEQIKISTAKVGLDEDEDSELIEFQQIENELRISELNRQMNNIQEELRLHLYKRLLSKTSNGSKSTKDRHQRQFSPQEPPSNRRNSAQTDESTPPSSSCSDEQTASSSMSNSDTVHSKLSVETDLISQFERCNLAKASEQLSAADKSALEQMGTEAIKNQDCPLIDSRVESSSKTNDLLSSALTPGHNYEAFKPTTSCNVQTSQLPPSFDGLRALQSNVEHSIVSNYAPNGPRKSPANNDLERIDEGEEEDNDYYSNSSVFRKIYEEKLSTLLQASEFNRSQTSNESQESDQLRNRAQSSAKNSIDTNNKPHSTPERLNKNDYLFNVSNVNSAKRSNRPLTMYMPKPDEDIDLVDLVQTMGHDLDIISDDLRICTTSAHGYLYKSCSNNNKKWLKRFFYFDRKMKTLSYYENEDQLVKKSGTPKCVISFDEICDVYVDHRLSELSEKQKGFKRKSYVFILATIKRKYVLASPKAETMRAWIDIFFTAAKANDHFQQLEMEAYSQESSDFQAGF